MSVQPNSVSPVSVSSGSEGTPPLRTVHRRIARRPVYDHLARRADSGSRYGHNSRTIVSGSGYRSRRTDPIADHPAILTSGRALSHITISSDDNAPDSNDIQLLRAENATLKNDLAHTKGRLEALECVPLFYYSMYLLFTISQGTHTNTSSTLWVTRSR